MQAGLEDHREAGPAAARHPDDVTRTQLREGSRRLGPPGARPGPGQIPLAFGQRPSQLRILGEVTLIAAHRRGQLVHGLAVLADLPGQPDDAAVGLELRERGLEQGRGAGPAGPAGQVDGHVVGGPEARVQRVGTGAGQAGHRTGVHAGLPEHHRVALDVDAAAAGPPGELGVLPRGQVRVGLAVPLVQLLDDHGPGRHVDAEREGLGREDRADQAGREQFLDHLLEGGQHAGVVRRDAAPQPGQPLAVAEHGQVLRRDVRGAALGDLLDHLGLFRRGQPQPRDQALLDRRVAAGPAEDERDRGQQAVGVEPRDHVGPVGRREPARPVSAAAGSLRGLALDPGIPLGHPQQLGIDPCVLVVGEQVIQPVPGQHVLPQRHRPVLVHDDLGAAANLIQPFAELLGVAHRRGQRHDPDRFGQVDDYFLPHRAAGPVRQVVHLVEHDVAEAGQRQRPGVQHVAEHLGGHHHHRRVAVDAVVPGEQAHRAAVVAAHQVGVLLVGQRLDRRGVEALAALGQRQVHGVLADHGLAGAGGRGHEHAVARAERTARLDLEGVEVEVVERAEAGQFGISLPVAERGVPVRRSGHGFQVRPSPGSPAQALVEVAVAATRVVQVERGQFVVGQAGVRVRVQPGLAAVVAPDDELGHLDQRRRTPRPGSAS